MSDLNQYERLGVGEDASFEEIQIARDHMLQTHNGDRAQVEAIEAAYDAVLMDRLRLRQEGKIKVPDRIRFPERLAEPPAEASPKVSANPPSWLQQFIDTPSRNDVLIPGGLLLAAGLLSLSTPAAALALGTGFGFYFLNRKENKFGRSFLLTLAGLVLGITLGLGLAGIIASPLAAAGLSPDTFAALVTLILLWLISSFLR